MRRASKPDDPKTDSPENREAIADWMSQNILEVVTEGRNERLVLISHKGIVSSADYNDPAGLERMARFTGDDEYPRVYFVGPDRFYDIQAETAALQARLSAAHTQGDVDAAFAPLRSMPVVVARQAVEPLAEKLAIGLYRPGDALVSRFEEAESFLYEAYDPSDLKKAFARDARGGTLKEKLQELPAFSNIALKVLEVMGAYYRHARIAFPDHDPLKNYGLALGGLTDEEYANPLYHAKARLAAYRQLQPPPAPAPPPPGANPFRALKL